MNIEYKISLDDLNNQLITLVSTLHPQIRQLKQLLIQRADINYQNEENGYTALMIAVRNQNDRIVDYLLRQGANPLIKTYENQIASELISRNNTIYPILKDFELLFAALNNDLLTAEAVIADGALVNFKGSGGYTALMIAVEQNFIEMVDFLLLKGADLSLTLANGQGVFDLVTDPNIFHLLKETSNLLDGFRPNTERYAFSFFNKIQ